MLDVRLFLYIVLMGLMLSCNSSSSDDDAADDDVGDDDDAQDDDTGDDDDSTGDDDTIAFVEGRQVGQIWLGGEFWSGNEAWYVEDSEYECIFLYALTEVEGGEVPPCSDCDDARLFQIRAEQETGDNCSSALFDEYFVEFEIPYGINHSAATLYVYQAEQWNEWSPYLADGNDNIDYDVARLPLVQD